MRKGSIAFSLFWLSAAWLIVALAGTAFLLTDLYSRSLDNNLTDQLKFNIDTLSSAVLDSNAPNLADVSLQDPRYNRAATGWYWVIRNGSGAVLATSKSAIGSVLPSLDGEFGADNYRTGLLTDESGNHLRAIERATTSDGLPVRIMVS
ncbi:MAG: hypothetical protein ABI697_05965, partial [Devosia sp.]